MHTHVLATGVLDAAQVQHLRARGGRLEHLLVRDGRDAAGSGNDSRVGGEDAVDVGVDLAEIGAQGRGESHGRRVGGAPAQGRHVLGGLRDPLESRDDDDVLAGQGGDDAAGGDVDDVGVAVGGRRDDPGLRTGVAARRDAEVGQGHGEQGGRLTLTGGEQHVELARGGLRRHLEGQVHEVVGGITHGRDDHDDLVAGLPGRGDPARNTLDGRGISHGGATELLDDSRHEASLRLGTDDRAILHRPPVSGDSLRT